MPPRIYPKRPVRLYLAEWREKMGKTQQQVADALETSDVTISRWETGKRRPDLNAQAAYAEVLGVELSDLWRDPARPTPNDLLRGQPEEVVEGVMKMLQRLKN